jgi:hypothetical protein
MFKKPVGPPGNQQKMQETDRLLRQNQKRMSDLGREFRKIIEYNSYAEIAVLLENGDYALAVEAKTQASRGLGKGGAGLAAYSI